MSKRRLTEEERREYYWNKEVNSPEGKLRLAKAIVEPIRTSYSRDMIKLDKTGTFLRNAVYALEDVNYYRVYYTGEADTLNTLRKILNEYYYRVRRRRGLKVMDGKPIYFLTKEEIRSIIRQILC